MMLYLENREEKPLLTVKSLQVIPEQIYFNGIFINSRGFTEEELKLIDRKHRDDPGWKDDIWLIDQTSYRRKKL